MSKRRDQLRTDLTLCFGESFFEGSCLRDIEAFLRRELPEWTSDLSIWRGEKRGPARRSRIGDFARDVQDAAAARGPLYAQLIKQHGAGPYQRRTGSVELRGSDNALIIVLTLDEYRFAPSAGRWLWGNTLTMQLTGTEVLGRAAGDFAGCIGAQACAALSPWYGHAELVQERDEKNISRADGGVMAIGGDISRYLPGLYWLNFFGEPYCNLIGRERLLTAPAFSCEAIDAGVLICLASSLEAWDSTERRTVEARVLAHLGDQYFFDRNTTERKTVAPDFGLEELPRNPRFS